MTYRLLDVQHEWPLVADEFAKRDIPMPNPVLDAIMGAFDDENVLQGFIVIATKFHFEPMVLWNPLVLRGLLVAAGNTVAANVGSCDIYAWGESEASKQICEAFGGIARTATAYLFHKEIN